MATIVQKYGGTSVGNPERIRRVAQRVLETQREGHRVVVVVSAMSGVTDSLLKLAKEVAEEPTEREMDVLLATGEQTTIALTAMAINGMGGKAASLTGAQAGIVTDGAHTKARITTISPKGVHDLLDAGHIVIVAGFQGNAADGRITTVTAGKAADADRSLPAAAQWKAHNYNHLMEQPTLFYAICLVIAFTGTGVAINVALAWAYVALRIAHSLVQATTNRVRPRFMLFLLSSLCLAALTLHAGIAVFRG